MCAVEIITIKINEKKYLFEDRTGRTIDRCTAYYVFLVGLCWKVMHIVTFSYQQ